MKILSNYTIKKINDGILLIDNTECKNIYRFNKIGEFILKNIDKDPNDIVESISKNCNISKEIAKKDYNTFISLLISERIVK